MATPETKCKLCLLCNDSEYPTFGHGHMKFHQTKGKYWRPEKGHKDYETHLRMVKLLALTI